MAAFSIAYGRTAEHAAQLKAGLARLPSGFTAAICDACDGHGERRQTFTHGCGRGCYTSMSGCDYCDGLGLRQGNSAAPRSVLTQVLNAAACN